MAATETANELARYLVSTKAAIETELDRRWPAATAVPPALHSAVRYTLLSGGKRLRGILVLATAEMFQRKTGGAMTAACAVEMVHASSLILDDLPCMDDATLRRGKPTLHREHGEANAVLAAVALLNGAFEILQREPDIEARARREVTAYLAHAIGSDGLIGGQVVDLEATGRELDLEGLEYVHSHKTGALFIGSAQMGARLAGARAAELDALHAYSKNLGLAFQVTDDLLDASGDAQTMGKETAQDEGKTTFVDLCGIDGARALTDELIGTAIDALAPFGRRAARLVALAERVRLRDR